jgi:AraC-like DNA-binding protein
MSDATPELGVLYTEYSSLTAFSPHLSGLWSFESRRTSDCPRVAINRAGDYEFGLDRTDPLLNVMLPDTSMSLLVNLGDQGMMGTSRATAAVLPRFAVLGPTTRPRQVALGRTIRAVGAGLEPTIAQELLGTRAARLVDRIVPLHMFWGRYDVHKLAESMSRLDLGNCALVLRMEVERRLARARAVGSIERTTTDLIKQQQGRISVEEITRYHGVGRQQLARRFRDTLGLSPKLFARITRFQQLVRALLTHDVADWALVSAGAGYYDQSHMINEFRLFAGAPPTIFFQPHHAAGPVPAKRLRGRPSEWSTPSDEKG